jgi:hypothetical protein
LSSIRVTYSGFIAFAVAFLGIITGTIFVIMVTRRLSPEEFGLWTLLGSLVSYVTIIEPILTYWTTRQIARGEQIGKTALSVNSLFTIVGFIIYFVIAIIVSDSLNVDISILLLASLLIPLSFVNNLLNSICAGFKPQSISYGIVAFEATKIPFGILFVIFLELGIFGAILTTIIASLSKFILLLIVSREKLHGSIDRNSIKFWFRMSWLTLYMNIHGFIYKLDVLIFSLMTTSLFGLAIWGVSSAISNFVGNSDRISQGLFPKLLIDRKKELIEENLKRSLFFAIPILGLTIIFAKGGLHILNPKYIEADIIVVILAFRTVCNIITGFFFGMMESYEDVDLDKNASVKLFIKSKLFTIPTLWLIFSLIYVISLFLFLLFFSDKPDMELVFYWSLILLSSIIPFMMYGIIIAYRTHSINFPLIPLIKYTAATIMALIPTYLISNWTLTYPEEIWEFLPQILPLVAMGGLLYFGIIYAIDKSTRDLVKLIIGEIWKK